ncbi:MAG TPA: AraC family transcriptional regulator [Allosphingosinicella sp.]|jgi:AraC family transcriptional regulator
MTKAADQYQARMLRVLEHIDGNLDADLSLDALSGVAAFSKHHFHRQFSAGFGLSVHRYVQLARLKRASWQLAYRIETSITEIALDAGYESPEAFARAFRDRCGQLPSAFRKAADWAPWLAALEPLNEARRKRMEPGWSAQDVKIVDFPATPVAILEHRGDPATIGASIQRFIAWRKVNRLRPDVSATFNIFHSDPATTEPADYRLSLCAGTTRPVEPNKQCVVPGEIPAGRCAMLRVTGGSDDLEAPALFLYRDWLPESGETLRDFPLFCRRVSFFPDVPEGEAVTELYLPLA